jgi:hypothetical protein
LCGSCQTPGDSVAYLTDFLLDDHATGKLASALKGVGAVGYVVGKSTSVYLK